MRIKRLPVSWAASYRKLMLAAYVAHPEAFTSGPTERVDRPLAWWSHRLGFGTSGSFVVGAVDAEDALRGVVGIRPELRPRLRHKATLFGLYVEPEARGHGLGRRLVNEALALLPQSTFVVRLTVSAASTSAQRLYEDCGFRCFGLERKAVRLGEGYIDKVHMRWERKPSEPSTKQ